MSADQLCQEEGCRERAIQCTLLCVGHDGKDEIEWLCPEHAAKAGFCSGCGTFAAGTEGFDFGRPAGMCDNCREELRHDMGEDDSDEEDFEL